jgi:dsDNA-binding SOS-regulon protein
MAALNRFISKLGEQGLPFFKLLKNQEKFVWTPEADQALAQLKDFLSKPPVLMAPRKGEQLLLYLAATTHVVSTAIIIERQEDDHAHPVQRPVYFVSEVLSESKARYQLSYGPPWAHYLSGYQDRLLGGPLGLPDLRCTAPDGVKHKDYGGEVLG